MYFYQNNKQYMKRAAWVCCVFFLWISCQKSADGNIPGTATDSTKSCRLVRMTQGLHNDTVYLVSYDDKGRIASILDSVNHNTHKAVYDASGNLVQISCSSLPYSFNVEYNSTGLISKITWLFLFQTEQYVYEYDAGKRPVKRTESIQNSSGTWVPYTYRTYTFNSDSDITRTSDTPASGGTTDVTNYTFTADQNIASPICLFNYAGYLGFYEIMDLDFYFNKHMVSSFTSSGESVQQSYTRDSSNAVAKIISQRTDAGAAAPYTFTRNFFYSCK